MRVCLPFVVVAGLAGLLVAADEDPKKKEMEKFQGKWVLVSAERSEMKEKIDEKKHKMTIKDNRFDHGNKDDDSAFIAKKGTFKIDPTKKTIDVTITTDDDGLFFGEYFGIYEWDGDNLKICSAPQKKDRPAKFTSKDNQLLQVWKKVKE